MNGTPKAFRSTPGARLASGGATVAAMFRAAARRAPTAPALMQNGESLCYGALAERIDRLTNAFARLGLKPGDRVAIVSENRREYIEIILACAAAGLIAACQNWRLTDPELDHGLKLVAPSLVIASERYADRLGTLDRETNHLVLGKDYERLIAREEATARQIAAEPEDGLLILYTSGTTGLSKGAVISHRAVVARAMTMAIDWSMRPSDGSIAWSPLFHMAAADPALASLCQGAPVYLIDGFDADRVSRALSEIDVGWFVLMPGMIERMIEAQSRRAASPRRVAAAGCMANLVPPDQIAAITTLVGAPFLNSFGSTETGIAPASGHMIAIGERPTSFTKQQTSFCDVRLIDEQDQEVPAGRVGEMTLRAPTLFSGYWNAPEVNARDFRGGWFHMGDDFIRHADGTLDFVDRRKYLIKSGGENIYPAELEGILRASPRIRDVVVVRQPDRRWGEVPVAFIVKNDVSLSEPDVVALLEGKLARYKLPKRILFVADQDLERNSTGKIQRQPLEARLAAEAAGETRS